MKGGVYRILTLLITFHNMNFAEFQEKDNN